MKRAGKTPPFVDPHGQLLPNSIAEVGYLRLGGLDQWVLMRGKDIANPPLILLHGGPGLSEMGFFRYFNSPLEQTFTVVNWDQRGAGRSYDAKTPRASMTVEQLIADLDELVDAVRERLKKDKVAIFGHSWGSALGVLYAARFPEKVAAYIGSGQIGDWQAGEAASYSFVTAEALRRGNHKAVQALREIGPPPHTADRLWVQRRLLARFESGLPLWKLLQVVVSVPESSLCALLDVYLGFRFSLDAMWAEVSALNLVQAAPALKVPVFFFLGRRDHWVPAEVSAVYFARLAAPTKKLLWFEASGHEPFIDEPDKFNAAMNELVRPLLTQGAA